MVKSLRNLFNFLVPSVQFLTFALIGCLLFWIVSWLFSRFKRQERSMPARRNLPKKIVSFFFVVFLFYVLQFYANTLNTESIVVNTEDLLFSKDQILKTNKEFCFWENSATEINFFKNVSFWDP